MHSRTTKIGPGADNLLLCVDRINSCRLGLSERSAVAANIAVIHDRFAELELAVH